MELISEKCNYCSLRFVVFLQFRSITILRGIELQLNKEGILIVTSCQSNCILPDLLRPCNTPTLKKIPLILSLRKVMVSQ